MSVYLKVLCGTIGSPPANVPAVTFKANGTTRQSYDAHGSSACAMGCHNLFDPPGFAFENYDGIGAYRTTEAGQPVDSTGTLVTPGNATITFQNALDLFKQLAKSTEAQSCVDRQWTRYMLGRGGDLADAGSMSVAYQKAVGDAGILGARPDDDADHVEGVHVSTAVARRSALSRRPHSGAGTGLVVISWISSGLNARLQMATSSSKPEKRRSFMFHFPK